MQKMWAKKLIALGFNNWVIWDTVGLLLFEECELTK